MIVSEEGRRYGGRSASERQVERLGRFVEAGIELFARQSVSRVTIEHICAEAGLTKRYFYQEFGSFEGYVDEVMTEVLNRVTVTGLGSRHADTAESWAEMRLSELMSILVDDPRLARLALVETFGASGALGRFRDRFVHRANEAFVEEMLPAETRHRADPARLALTARALTGASAEVLVAWLSGDLDGDADEIVSYLVGLYVAAGELVVERDVR